MFDYRKYIFRIVLFLSLILLFIYFFHDGLSRGFNHNKELNSAIVVIFLIGIFLVFKNLNTLKKDQEWLEHYGKQKSISTKPILLRDLKALYELYRSKNIPINIIRDCFDRVVVKLDSERELIKYISALLVFLGLLGTFWGLLITIESVGVTISNMSIDEENILTNFMNLKEGLSIPLSGMGTAFSSSLFGLSGSLCLGFIDLQGNRAQNEFLQSLEKAITRYNNFDKPIKSQEVGKEYIHALLLQTVESLKNLENVLSKNEESRKNFEDLIIESSKVISKINNEISIRMNQYNKNEVTNLENIRNIDDQLKDIKEIINSNKENNTKDLAKEIQILAKTISLIQNEKK